MITDTGKCRVLKCLLLCTSQMYATSFAVNDVATTKKFVFSFQFCDHKCLTILTKIVIFYMERAYEHICCMLKITNT
jgi:hypothetical protein